MIRYLAAALLAGTALAASPASAQLIPGNYPVTLDQSRDQSGLVISSAPTSAVPTTQWGDQGYTVNSWSTGCNCMGNPYLNNNDTQRIIAYNPGTGAAQVNGLSIYAVGGAASVNGVGSTTGLHVVEVANNSGSMWGIDTMQADSPNQAGYVGPGRYLDNEFDFNIGGAQTVMTGLSIGGTLLARPAYGAGIAVNFIGAGKINESFYSWDGAADTALHAGLFSKPQTANAGSQPIQMDWTDSANNKNNLTLTAFENTMVLQTSDGAAPPAWGVSGATGIYATVQVSASCKLTVSGGLITDRQGC